MSCLKVPCAMCIVGIVREHQLSELYRYFFQCSCEVCAHPADADVADRPRREQPLVDPHHSLGPSYTRYNPWWSHHYLGPSYTRYNPWWSHHSSGPSYTRYTPWWTPIIALAPAMYTRYTPCWAPILALAPAILGTTPGGPPS